MRHTGDCAMNMKKETKKQWKGNQRGSRNNKKVPDRPLSTRQSNSSQPEPLKLPTIPRPALKEAEKENRAEDTPSATYSKPVTRRSSSSFAEANGVLESPQALKKVQPVVPQAKVLENTTDPAKVEDNAPKTEVLPNKPAPKNRRRAAKKDQTSQEQLPLAGQRSSEPIKLEGEEPAAPPPTPPLPLPPAPALEQAPPTADEAVPAPEAAVEFQLGDVVWAYLHGYPLWPSMVTADLELGVHFKFKNLAHGEMRVFNVQFFGDGGSHSWLPAQRLFPYQGDIQQLYEMAVDGSLDKKAHKRDVQSKTKLLHSIKKAMKGDRPNWQTACDEANQCLGLSTQGRVDYMGQLIERKREELRRKRKAERPQPRRAKRARGGSPTPPSPPHAESQAPAEPQAEAEPQGHSGPDREEPAARPAASTGAAAAAATKRRKRAEKAKKEPVCEACGTRGAEPVVACSRCRLPFHALCIRLEEEQAAGDADAEPLCPVCRGPDDGAECALCGAADGRATVRCSLKTCGRTFHGQCLQTMPSPGGSASGRDSGSMICPWHYCHTCVAELHTAHHTHKKLLRCIKCPTAYHSSEMCLGAGCVQLSASQMICSKHGADARRKTGQPTHVNANWCFTCSQGGRLICCERCPASFHTHCLRMEQEPEGSYVCYECTTGKTILYGDLVWVKIGAYRWWPARVSPLDEIPAQFHDRPAASGEFLVQFYGSHDFAFVQRGQAFHYQEGDRGTRDSSKRTLAVRYKAALDEALAAFEQRRLAIQQHSVQRQAQVNVKPPPYVRIRNNKAVGRARIYESSSRSSPAVCECDAGQEQPCGPDSECLNRMLLIECDPAHCPAGGRCQNQRFQKRAYPELYTFNTGGKGWGLKAQVDLKKGDFVIEYVGEVIDVDEFQQRLRAKQDAQDESFYFLTLDTTRVIDAGPRGNLARFMNHSCQPNCQTQKWTVNGDTRVGLFALQDVPAHAELTFNYQLVCARDAADAETPETRRQVCHCGADRCAGFIGAKSQKAPAAAPSQPLKTKKRKVSRKALLAAADRLQADDDCFRCAEGGRLIMCDVKSCSKVYHLECLDLQATPKGKWECPWHHCDVCGRRAALFCSICPNSFCPAHQAASGVRVHDQLGPVCDEHTADDVDFFVQRRRRDAPADADPQRPADE